jgi:Domain of unknown function (DUF4329)
MPFTIPEITIVGQLPPSKSQAGQPFPTADEAAVAALDEILPVSIGNDFEYSGAIARRLQDGKFVFTRAETQDDPKASNPNPQPPSGTQLIGVYHTHGAGTGKNNAENFSADDIFLCLAKKTVIFWLGTPSRRIKKLIPPDLLSPADKQSFGFFGKQIILR